MVTLRNSRIKDKRLAQRNKLLPKRKYDLHKMRLENKLQNENF